MTMATTGIQFVRNKSSHRLSFLKVEDRKNNRLIAAGAQSAEVGDCWVPWCSSEQEFRDKVIVLINMPKREVLGYVWQQKPSSGDDERVRFSRTGWEDGTEGNRMPGYSTVGGKINLIVDHDGNVSAEQHSVAAAEGEG